MWLLDACGYVARTSDTADAVLNQPAAAISCLWMLMTFIPAAVSLLAIVVVWFYPLTSERVDDIVGKLKAQRAAASDVDVPEKDEMTDFANV
ncbi:MAG: hypothetical protein K2J49_06830 [Muribaculaceae bacterium]|nr:hypothetical protein [Muribaculaceae bacterium]